jgi:hypothetical protein
MSTHALFQIDAAWVLSPIEIEIIRAAFPHAVSTFIFETHAIRLCPLLQACDQAHQFLDASNCWSQDLDYHVSQNQIRASWLKTCKQHALQTQVQFLAVVSCGTKRQILEADQHFCPTSTRALSSYAYFKLIQPQVLNPCQTQFVLAANTLRLAYFNTSSQHFHSCKRVARAVNLNRDGMTTRFLIRKIKWMS